MTHIAGGYVGVRQYDGAFTNSQLDERPLRLTYVPLDPLERGDIADCFGTGPVCHSSARRIGRMTTLVPTWLSCSDSRDMDDAVDASGNSMYLRTPGKSTLPVNAVGWTSAKSTLCTQPGWSRFPTRSKLRVDSCKNAQATPALNVKRNLLPDRMQLITSPLRCWINRAIAASALCGAEGGMTMTPTGISGAAAARAADAMLQTLGGTEVSLLFPAAGMPGDTVAGLGLVDPGVDQAVISPVIVVELTTENNGPRRRIELLAGQAAMAQQVSQRNVASAEVLFETALGLVYCGEMFHIEGFVVERIAGVAYLYRVAAMS